MKLIVGLGNPGKEYENTRHNVGFMVIDKYASGDKFSEKFNGLYLEKNINGTKTIFLKPLSYMNLSGTVVRAFADYFKISLEDILIIRDDLDIEIGEAKLKFDSSSGGDNGVKSIIKELGSQKFCQFKIGISSPKKNSVIDYVLGKFSKEELNKLNNILDKSGEIIDMFINSGIEKTMNTYNGMLKWK